MHLKSLPLRHACVETVAVPVYQASAAWEIFAGSSGSLSVVTVRSMARFAEPYNSNSFMAHLRRHRPTLLASLNRSFCRCLEPKLLSNSVNLPCSWQFYASHFMMHAPSGNSSPAAQAPQPESGEHVTNPTFTSGESSVLRQSVSASPVKHFFLFNLFGSLLGWFAAF